MSVHSELSVVEVRDLEAVHPFALGRFDHYRRSGHDVDQAFRFALAWGRNVTEQKLRRVSHGTGAT